MIFRTREAFAEVFSEMFFFRHLRKVLSEVRSMPECPIYVYILDYSIQSRGALFPEEFLPLHYGKCHAMDLWLMLNFLSADSEQFKVTPSDVAVNETFQNILRCFIKGDEQNLGLVKYAESELVNRISESGIDHVDKSCLQLNDKMLKLKALSLGALLKLFPNRF